jgi:hypothetical protein
MSTGHSHRARIGAGIAALIGLALFVWSIRNAGTTAVLEGVRRVGAGILVVWLLGGFRALIRTAAWRLCLDRNQRIDLRTLFAAYLAGDAIGNVTPFGFLISEPSKIVLVRRHIRTPAAVAALAVENLFYGSTVVVMLVAGTIALLSYAVPPAVRAASVATLAGAIAFGACAAWILTTRRRVVSGAMGWLIRHNVAAEYLEARLPHVEESGDRIFRFASERPRAVLPLMALESSYHIAAIAEIWIALSLITGTTPTLTAAFVLEYVNRTITAVFQFVPMWLGVDEAGTSLATRVIGIGTAAGVSLALVRKARNVLWTAIGIGVLLHRGMSIRGAHDDAEAFAAQAR